MNSFIPFFSLPTNLGIETEHAPVLEKARELVQEALNLMGQSNTHFESEKGWLVAHALSLRVVESCEASIILIDKGMSGAAWATLRTAWECIFYAAAMWRNPARFKDFTETHFKERLTQAQMLFKRNLSQMTERTAEQLTVLVQEPDVNKKWACFNAAQEAELEDEYNIYYRGSAFMGAHATQRGLDAHFTQVERGEEGEYVLTYAPNFSVSDIQISATIDCLTLAIKRFQTHLSEISS